MNIATWPSKTNPNGTRPHNDRGVYILRVTLVCFDPEAELLELVIPLQRGPGSAAV